MMEYSSFMVPWNAIFGLFSGSAVVAMVALAFLLNKSQGKLLTLDPHCTNETFWTSLIVTGICSIILVLILQVVANFAFNIAFAGGAYTRGTIQLARSLEHSKGGLAILVVTILVGGGYAFSFADVSFTTHLFSCTIGIGFLEESAKCLAALLVFAGFYRQHGFRYSLTPFVVAGLGFGGGEALHYFGTYNMIESGFATYIIRAWWCVPLHAAWALIAGERIVRRFNGVPDIGKLKGNDYVALVGCLFPSIALHGVYDAFCFHDIFLSWGVGIASLVWAFSILARPKDQFYAKNVA